MTMKVITFSDEACATLDSSIDHDAHGDFDQLREDINPKKPLTTALRKLPQRYQGAAAGRVDAVLIANGLVVAVFVLLLVGV